MTTTVATLKAVFTADTANFDKGKRKVESGLSNLGASISGLGDSMSGMGRSMLSFAAPMTAALGGAVYAAMDFDEQLRNIQAVTGQSTGQIDALGQSILDMNTRFSSTELATTFYDIAGGVTDASQRMDVFNTAIHVAQAGNAGLQGTTQALIATMNAYADANLSAADAGDILTRTVGMGVGTMDQFAAALPNVIGIASSVGISFEEIAAATAYLTTKGNSASEATTQLSAAISALLTPNAAMTEAFKMAGIESGSLALSSEGLMGTLNLLKDSFGGNVDEMAKAFGSVEALRAVVSLAGGDVDEFFTTFSEGVDGATAAAEKVQLQSAAAQFDMLKSSLQDVAIQVGLALLPALNRIGRAVLPLVTKFANWAKANPRLITTIAAIAVGITGLGIAFTVIGGILGVVSTTFGVLGAVLAFVASPIGLVVAGFVALGAAFAWLVSNNIFGLGDAFRSLWDGLKEGLGILADFAGGLLAAFQSGGISEAFSYFKSQFVIVLAQLVNTAVNTGADIVKGIADGLSQGIPQITEKVKTGAAAIGPAFAATMAQQAPAFAQGAGEMTKAIENEGPKASRQGGVFAGLLAGEFITAMITYGPTIAGAAAVIGYHMVSGLLSVAETVGGIALSIAGNFVAGFYAGIIFRLPAIWEALKTQFNTLIGDPAKEWFNGMAQDAAQGFKDGFGLSNIGEWMRGEVEKMVNKVKEFLGIASPSTVFKEIGVNVGQGFINGVNAILGGLTSAAQAMYNAVQGPLRAMITLANEAVSAVNNAVSSSIGSPISPTIVGGTGSTQQVLDTSLGLPGRAAGGPVAAGTPYIVGEKGPEMFVPKSSGTIIPNHALASSGGASSGGGGVTISGGTFILQGVQNVEDLYYQLAQLNRNKSKPAFAKAG